MSFDFGCKNVKVKPKSGCPQLVVVSDTINRFGFYRAQQLSEAVFDTFKNINKKIDYGRLSTDVMTLSNAVLEVAQTYLTNKTKEQINDKHGVK